MTNYNLLKINYIRKNTEEIIATKEQLSYRIDIVLVDGQTNIS